MNTKADNQIELLQKVTVKQDVCIEFYRLNFKAEADNKKNAGLDGKARTIIDIKEIFEVINNKFANFEITRTKDRYVHAIEMIRFQERSIELLVSCNDTQHQGVVKKHRKNKKRTPVAFLMDEGSETVSHVVIRFDEDNRNIATVFFERTSGITLTIVEKLINSLLESIRREDSHADLFKEPYISDSETPFYFKIKAEFSPIADKEILERIKTGDFIDLRIIEKKIEQEEHELPLLTMYESQNIFKPSNFFGEEYTVAKIISGLVKIGRKNKKSTLKESTILYKLRYSDAGNTRIVELQPEEENIASMCQKKKWFKEYERKVVNDGVIIDEILCKKMFNINIDDYADIE